MRFCDIKARELGFTRRIEELEDALQHIQLAAEVAHRLATEENEWSATEGLRIIQEKVKKVLNSA